MAVFYVVSTNVGERVAELQARDFENTYVSRETLSHFDKINASNEQKTEAIKDIMSICDAVILMGQITPRMAVELRFAKLIKMEVITDMEKNNKTTKIEFSLDGTKSLQVMRVTSNGTSTNMPQVEILAEFALKEITTEELRKYRASKIPSFLLKVLHPREEARPAPPAVTWIR